MQEKPQLSHAQGAWEASPAPVVWELEPCPSGFLPSPTSYQEHPSPRWDNQNRLPKLGGTRTPSPASGGGECCRRGSEPSSLEVWGDWRQDASSVETGEGEEAVEGSEALVCFSSPEASPGAVPGHGPAVLPWYGGLPRGPSLVPCALSAVFGGCTSGFPCPRFSDA